MTTALEELARDIAIGTIKVIDLTAPLCEETPVLPTPPGCNPSRPVTIDEISRYDDRGPLWFANNLSFGEHSGTHFDAPAHWITGRNYRDGTLDRIPAERLIGPACVIDLRSKVAENPDYLMTVADIADWESSYGPIPQNSWVLMHSGWSKRTDPADFLNADEDGLHQPGPSVEAVRFLIDEREILGFGSEAIGTDAGQAFSADPPLPYHHYGHQANRYGLASLCNLDLLPPKGAVLIAAPLRIKNGSGSPCRVLALVAR